MTPWQSASITLVEMRASFIQISIALLTLIVPEIWKDTFDWLRRSPYWRWIQFAVVLWILTVVSVSLSKETWSWGVRHRFIATVLLAVLGALLFGGGFLILSRKSAPESEATAALNAPSSDAITQRARVIISNIESDPLVPEAGKFFRVILTIKNIGPTPAKKCRAYYVIEPVKVGERPNFSYANNRLVQMGNLSPATEQRAYLNPMINEETKEPALMTSEVLEQLTNGTMQLVAHGRVDYEDVFGRAHWFTFAMNVGFPRDQGFGVWPEHNDSDD